MENIGPKPKISKEFTDEFKRALTIGLPCMSLEKHGGPPVIPASKRQGNFCRQFPPSYSEYYPACVIRSIVITGL